jgi:hypothetical protein
MVPASAAFGNSFTLPAVFLTTLLPKPLADKALGYAALFLLAWSPCLWSIGLALVEGKQAPRMDPSASASTQQGQGDQQAPGGTARRKPLYWREPRVVDVTPISPGSSDEAGSSARQPEPPGWVERLAVHPWTTRLARFFTQASLCGLLGHILLPMECTYFRTVTALSLSKPPRMVHSLRRC